MRKAPVPITSLEMLTCWEDRFVRAADDIVASFTGALLCECVGVVEVCVNKFGYLRCTKSFDNNRSDLWSRRFSRRKRSQFYSRCWVAYWVLVVGSVRDLDSFCEALYYGSYGIIVHVQYQLQGVMVQYIRVSSFGPRALYCGMPLCRYIAATSTVYYTAVLQTINIL